MTEPLRVGIVGATVTPGGSGWGQRAHVPALKSVPGLRLEAVCTAHEETAKASAKTFGARLAFHDFGAMVASPDIDVAAVVVRVPLHHGLVMAALAAGKAVYCEWPLGANLAEAREMAQLAKERGLSTMVGMQARSDPAIRYARKLVQDGFIGDVLTANLKAILPAEIERGPGRIWQGIRANGANPLTIPGGHSMDSLRFIVGDFVEVTARLATRIREFRNTQTGEVLQVDAPDTISVAALLAGGVEAAIHVATAPSNASGYRLELHGRDGVLVITAPSVNIGPNRIFAARGKETLAELTVPEEFHAARNVPPGPPQNVAHAYARFAEAMNSGTAADPDFDTAVEMHRIIDAIERSAAERRAITL